MTGAPYSWARACDNGCMGIGESLVERVQGVLRGARVRGDGARLLEAVLSPSDRGLHPAALFDAFASGAESPGLARVFDVLSRGGAPLAASLRPGDLLVRRALGEGSLGHVAMLVTGELVSSTRLRRSGWVAESARPGLFAVVIEAGPHVRLSGQRFARRVADASGMVPQDTLLLRPRDPRAAGLAARPRDTSSERGAPAGAAPSSYGAPRAFFVRRAQPVSTEPQAAPNAGARPPQGGAAPRLRVQTEAIPESAETGGLRGGVDAAETAPTMLHDEPPVRCIVIDPDARLRDATNLSTLLTTAIPQEARVRVLDVAENGGDSFVNVEGVDGTAYGWTKWINLAPFIYTVHDSDARVRDPADLTQLTTTAISRYARVRIQQLHTSGTYAYVVGVDRRDWGWTRLTNLTTYFKDDEVFKGATLAPATALGATSDMAKTYNRLGGLMRLIATALGVGVQPVLAVWQVESNNVRHVPGQCVIRFENHKLWDHWGSSHAAVFNDHFQFDSAVRSTMHKIREAATDAWTTLHPSGVTVDEFQRRQYQALRLATRVATAEAALLSISMGGPQIMGDEHRRLGYLTPEEMFIAFQGDERAHVLGFFDFVRSKNLVRHIRTPDWTAFATGYNGDPGYATNLQTALTDATTLIP